MLKLKRKKNCGEVAFRSKVAQMVQEIQSHKAWKGEISLEEISLLLKKHKPFTYALSQGVDRTHYVLSYLSLDGSVLHKKVRIIFSAGDWVWKNGGNHVYQDISSLIPDCLKSSEDICEPLTS